MIVAAAVVPGAPFLVPGVADPIAARTSELTAACRQAVGGLSGADRIVLVSAARWPSPARRLPPGTVPGGSPLRRRDLGDGAPPVIDPAVGSIVGAAVLRRARPELDLTRVLMVETGADPTAAAALITAPEDESRIGLLVVADGAAAHGEHAPGRRDDRSAEFDDALAAALGDGDPAALARACADRDLGRQLLAVTDPLRVLALLTAAEPPTGAELLYCAHPYGVGYLVAGWRWSRG